MYLLLICLLIVVLVWVFERRYLRGPGPGEYSAPATPGAVHTFTRPPGVDVEHEIVVKTVRNLTSQISFSTRKESLHKARAVMDSMSDDRHYVSEFRPVDAGGVAAEWVLAPGVDTSRRVLYIHGGGFVMGSAKSHRTITSKFSEITAYAVLAINYRLLPEHKHMDCVGDCRAGYQWLLDNGPDGTEKCAQLVISGDSAGGNLALSLIAWIRDSGLRAPDAAVALSPLTDATFSAASIHDNEQTDVMLKPVMRALNTMPRFIKSWWVLWVHRLRPANPVISPLLGELSNLPPILIQASEAEMLLDDARRYVYKACASGSPVKLQTWTNMVHVWQIFDPQLPQAAEAWIEIGKFIADQESASK